MKKTALLVLILVIMSQMVMVKADESIGVAEGDWFEYSWTYTEQNATNPEDDFGIYHEYVWSKITVEKINGTQITAKQESRSETDENKTLTYEFDPYLENSLFGMTYFEDFIESIGCFIENANLTAGDPLLPDYSLTDYLVNETIQRTYLETIEVAHLSLNWTAPLWFMTDGNGTITDSGPLYTFVYDYYWERSTGVLQEMFLHGNSTEADCLKERRILIINRGFEVIPEFSRWTTVLILVTILSVTAVVVRKRLVSKLHRLERTSD